MCCVIYYIRLSINWVGHKNEQKNKKGLVMVDKTKPLPKDKKIKKKGFCNSCKLKNHYQSRKKIFSLSPMV
jgi:hypothetical protein